MLRFLKNLFGKTEHIDNIKNYHQNYKSDRRLKGGKVGICLLCENRNVLRLSHIIPKWCYQWCKAEGDGKIIGDYRSIGIRTMEQDGNKHYLLCEDCEQYLGISEKYVQILMHGSDEEQQSVGININEADYAGLNVDLIRRFVLGIALKSHYATSAPFHTICVSENHIKILRSQLLTPNQDDLSLVIAAMQFYSLDSEIDPRAIIIPSIVNTRKVKFLSFLIAGWEWILFFNEKRYRTIDNPFIQMRLKENGEMRIPSGDILDQRLIVTKFRK